MDTLPSITDQWQKKILVVFMCFTAEGNCNFTMWNT